jgi:hypothetical protein
MTLECCWLSTKREGQGCLKAGPKSFDRQLHFAESKVDLEDPLFVKVGQRIFPTDRCSVLIVEVEVVLEKFDRLTTLQSFDPARSRARLCLLQRSREVRNPSAACPERPDPGTKSDDQSRGVLCHGRKSALSRTSAPLGPITSQMAIINERRYRWLRLRDLNLRSFLVRTIATPAARNFPYDMATETTIALLPA